MIENPRFNPERYETLRPADRVVVTGMAARSSLGDTNETFERLVRGESGIISLPGVNHRTNIGALMTYDPKEYLHGKDQKLIGRYSPAAVLAVILAREAGRQAGILDESGRLNTQLFNPRIVANTVSTSSGGMDEFANVADFLRERHYKNKAGNDAVSTDRLANSEYISPFSILTAELEQVNGQVSMALGLQGWPLSSVEACATGLSSIIDGYELLRRGRAVAVLAGATDVILSRRSDVDIGAFAALKATSARNEDPKGSSRPFDVDRDGLVLGDGGAVVVLESLESALKRGVPILAEVLNVTKASDGGNHATELNLEKMARVMESALSVRGDPKTLYLPDAWYSHATSTPQGDSKEAQALKLVLAQYAKKVLIAANKSGLGHTLGGAGALSFVNAIQSILRGVVPPIRNLTQPDAEIADLSFVRDNAVWTEINQVLITAFGFGGFMSALTVGKYR